MLLTTLGAIALQGIRQAKVEMGESIVVLGLGLVGLVTMKLLKAAGAFPVGVDIDNSAVNFCRDLGFNAYNSKDLVYNDFTKQTVSGYGFDKSIITASTSSSQPFDFSIEVLRDRGHITVVGDLPIKFSRKDFYYKELSMNISRSYGAVGTIQIMKINMDLPIGMLGGQRTGTWQQSLN